MRRPIMRPVVALLLALFSVSLAGCDLHSKTWDPESPSNPNGGPSNPGSLAGPTVGEIGVTVATSGAIECKVNGEPQAALTNTEIARNDGSAAATRLLIVQNSARDTQACFTTPIDLDSLCVNTVGKVTVRHLGHNLTIEADGPARVSLYPRDPQDDVDDCVAFAGEDEIDRLAALLNADPNLINGRDSKLGRTPLARATENGRARAVAALLQRRANTEIKDSRGFTPLHIAASRSKLAIVKLLVKAGADVNAQTQSGDTALRLASKSGYTEIAAFLSGAGANGEVADSPGRTAHGAVNDPVQDEVFELADQRDRGPFADGTSIRYKSRKLSVLRAGSADGKGREQYDLPKSRDRWIALQDTNFRVMVRSKGRMRVWVTYHPIGGLGAR